MSASLAAAVGGAAGAVALLLVMAAVFVPLCIIRRSRSRRSASRNSETNSSDRSTEVIQSELLQGFRPFTLEELDLATKGFSRLNFIGHGSFGEVYKGLLPDGMVVAIKRRISGPSPVFLHEVQSLAAIGHHRNVVALLGYCQEDQLQMLVYEYVPNGSVAGHLRGGGQTPGTKLEFKHRLSIAHGAAKGLSHLHSQNPAVVHMGFKTANVLVDEDFNPKVADAALHRLLRPVAGSPVPAIQVHDPFPDPESTESERHSTQSDVYSFGVFLAELVTGQEASANRDVVDMVRGFRETTNVATIVDPRMGSSFTSEGMKELLRLASWCLNPAMGQRPPASFVATEIDRIREKEISMTTFMGAGTPTVVLGSQLFTPK